MTISTSDILRITLNEHYDHQYSMDVIDLNMNIMGIILDIVMNAHIIMDILIDKMVLTLTAKSIS